jgi:hypothetical protein
MANQQHLDLLKQSVETWYKLGRELAGIQLDLSGADPFFYETYLGGKDNLPPSVIYRAFGREVV